MKKTYLLLTGLLTCATVSTASAYAFPCGRTVYSKYSVVSSASETAYTGQQTNCTYSGPDSGGYTTIQVSDDSTGVRGSATCSSRISSNYAQSGMILSRSHTYNFSD